MASPMDAPLGYAKKASLGFPKGDYGVDYGVLTDKFSDRVKIIKGLDISTQTELVFYLDEILEKLGKHTLRNLMYAWMYERKSPSDSNIYRPGKGGLPPLYFISIDPFKKDVHWKAGLTKLKEVADVDLPKHPILEKNKLPSTALSLNLLKLIKKCSAKSPIVKFTVPDIHQLTEFDVKEKRNSPGNGYPLASLRVATYSVNLTEPSLLELMDFMSNSELSETLTALGRYNLNLFAGGEIDISDNVNVKITYNKFAYFFQDYFDFKENRQTLGVWSFEGVRKWRSIIQELGKKCNISMTDHPDEITNEVMRDFKGRVIPKYNNALESGKWLIPEGLEEAKLVGRDFKILSPVVPYEMPPVTREIPMADLIDHLNCLP